MIPLEPLTKPVSVKDTELYVVLSLVTDIATSVFKSSVSYANTTTREVDGVEFAVNVSETKVIELELEVVCETDT